MKIIHLKDPHGDYSMIGVVPAIFIVNKAALMVEKFLDLGQIY